MPSPSRRWRLPQSLVTRYRNYSKNQLESEREGVIKGLPIIHEPKTVHLAMVAALHDSSPEIRQVALEKLLYTPPTKRLLVLLDRISKKDPDKHVRQKARYVLYDREEELKTRNK